MAGHDPRAGTAENYRRFARLEARGRSPRYEQLAEDVARDPEILSFLGELPPGKRQPNLLFAAARYLLGEPADIRTLRTLVASRRDELTAQLLSLRTQTNEPLRCATLLPVLASIPGPLALLEVGASAGLTLLPDRYSYSYDGHLVTGSDPLAPVLACSPRGPVPLPAKVPEVVWRGGLDLNPLDVMNDDDVRWLQCLLWPGETGRAERLAASIQVARREPPLVRRGDLLTDVPALAATAPRDATLVVFHSAVLAYLGAEQRECFAEGVRALDAVWLSNEAPGVVTVASPGEDRLPPEGGHFVLVRDGVTPVALTDPHGTWVSWLSA
jgi:hypothetical protein